MPSASSIHLVLDGNDACVGDLGLWMDPHRAREFAFVSHAHADHFAPHGRILCSTSTRRLIEARYGAAAQRAGILDLAFGEVRELDGYRIELIESTSG
jgi:DNA ligase-1